MSDSVQPYELEPARLLCPWTLQGRILEWVAIPFFRGPWLEEYKRSPFLEFMQDQPRTCPAERAETGSSENIKVVLWVHCKRLARSLPQNSNKFCHLVFMTGISRKNEAKSTQLLDINVVQGEDKLGIGHETFPPSSSSPVPPQVRLRQTNNSRNSFCCPEFSISWD